MILRDYQQHAVDSVVKAYGDLRKVLGVAATGTGKSVMLAHILKRRLVTTGGRGLVIAHREELIRQNADKIQRVTGWSTTTEMADERADRMSPVVVSSIQTQTRRHKAFDPGDFTDIIIDEAHHAPSASYRRVIDHYMGNGAARLLGVTATPDRLDERPMGMVFDHVAFDFDIDYGVAHGWLVPIVPHRVFIESIDLVDVKANPRDLNEQQLADVMERDENILGVASWLAKHVHRRCLVFAASVQQAHRISEAIRDHGRTSSWVCGETANRKDVLEAFRRHEYDFLVNCQVLTEGYDDDGVACVAIARPTKSRALYAQMVGRGTRPTGGCVDGVADRHAAIAASPKPDLHVVDFVGNTGTHALVSTCDILGTGYTEDEIHKAEEIITASPMDVRDALERAREVVAEEEERNEHAALVVVAKFRAHELDPFRVLNIGSVEARGWGNVHRVKESTAKMLADMGVPKPHLLSENRGRRLVQELLTRRLQGKPDYRQTVQLLAIDRKAETASEAARIIAEATA